MKEIVVAVLAQPNGLTVIIIFGTIFTVLILGLVLSLLPLIKKKIKTVRRLPGIVFDSEEGKEDVLPEIPATIVNGRVTISKETLNNLKDIFESQYEMWYSSKENQITKNTTTYITKVEECLKDTLSALQMGYQGFINEEDDLSEQDDWLKLFIESEFCQILKMQLEALLKERQEVANWNEYETSERIASIINSCTARLLVALHKYTGPKLINGEAFSSGFDGSKSKIQDGIGNTIKSFVKMTQKEREDMDVLLAKRIKNIDERLERIFNVSKS
jgi:hypothetical protein